MSSGKTRGLVVFGTRPEAVKMAPILDVAARYDDWTLRVCSTGQHPDLLPAILSALELRPDIERTVMRPGQTLDGLLGTLLRELGPVLDAEAPSFVVAQGDTTSVLAAAISAHHHQIPFVHVEAGLRTGNRMAPFPEEGNRVLVAQLAALHLAPTPRAVSALRSEGICERSIMLTGNTAVDAVRSMSAKVDEPSFVPEAACAPVPRDRDLVLVTGHRRESFGGGLSAVCDGVGRLARRHPNVAFVYPLHVNPAVARIVRQALRGLPNVFVIPAVGYPTAVWLMRRARFVITDSGGIQEEAPELGKPVLVTRVSTERPEAVAQGSAVVVGYDENRLFEVADRWLSDPQAYRAVCPRSSPFGDGRSAERCVAAIRRLVGLPAPTLPEFNPSVASALGSPHIGH